MKKKSEIVQIGQNDIKSRMLVVRNQAMVLDCDVAAGECQGVGAKVKTSLYLLAI